MSNTSLWGKLILFVYNSITAYVNKLDELILRCGLNSFIITDQTYHLNNIFAVTEKIIELSEQKIKLINVKVLIDESLNEMEFSDSQMLICKYIKGFKIREIASLYKISERSIYRNMEKSKNIFCNILKRKGYDDQRLEEMLKDQPWIMNLRQKFIEQEGEENERCFCI